MPLFYSRPKQRDLPSFTIDASKIQVLHHAKEFHQQLLQRIATAERRIYLCSLYLQHDEGGESILLALYKAKQARPALDIKVFVDYHRARRGLIGATKQAGNAAWYQSVSEQLGAGQVPIYGIPVQTRELFGVLHLKGFILDDTIIYSGASLNNVYLHIGERYRFDRYHLIDDRALADSFTHYLCQQLFPSDAIPRLDKNSSRLPSNAAIRELRKHLAQCQYRVNVQGEKSNGVKVTPLCGIGKGNAFNLQIETLLANAKVKITICTPYFNPPKSILRILQRQIKKGVKIEIIVGDKTANDFYTPPEQAFRAISALPYLYESNLRRFAKHNQSAIQRGQLSLRLWQHEQNSYHLKGIWIDDTQQLITGNNLNPRAFHLDLENGLLLNDPAGTMTKQTEAELANIRQHTSLIQHYQQLETLTNYPAPVTKLLGRLKRVRLDRLLNRLL